MALSDKRLKTNIQELLLEESITHVKNVKLISFDYIDEKRNEMENDKISIDTDTSPYTIQTKDKVLVMDKIYNYSIDVRNTWKLSCDYNFLPNKYYYFLSPDNNVKIFGRTDENGQCTICSILKHNYQFEYLTVESYEVEDFVVLYKLPTLLHTTNVTKYLLDKIETLEQRIKELENKV